jgi:hypothetical protein
MPAAVIGTAVRTFRTRYLDGVRDLHLLIRKDPQAKDVSSDMSILLSDTALTYQNSRAGAGRSYDGSVAKHGVQSLGGIIICSWRRVAEPHVTLPPVDSLPTPDRRYR